MKKITFAFLFTCIFTTFIFAEKNVTSLQELEKNKDQIYSKKDNVLYYLDSGMLAYYEDDFSGAIERLSKAEQSVYRAKTRRRGRRRDLGIMQGKHTVLCLLSGAM